MRTLLDELLPPQCADEHMFSPIERQKKMPRTFSQNAVLGILDDFSEVGLGETVSATPSAGAISARPALERCVAILEATNVPSQSATPAPPESLKVKETVAAS